MLYNFLSFFNKRTLTFVCYSYYKKESLKIRKVNSKTGNFMHSSNKILRINVRINKYLSLFVINT